MKWIRLVSLLLCPTVLIAQIETQSRYKESVEVNVRTILVLVTDSKGKPVASPLTPADVEVLVDGVPAKVLGVDLLPTSSSRPTAALPLPNSARPAIEAIPQILYLDASLLQTRGVKRVAEIAEKNLPSILSRGPLEIVLADPEPRVVLASTSDPMALRRFLDKASTELVGRDRLGDVRRDYLRARNDETRANAKLRLSRVRASAQEEIRLVEQSLERLEEWVSGASLPPAAILFFANDGFDTNPIEFYQGLSNPIGAGATRSPRGGSANEEQQELAQLRAEFGPLIARLLARLSTTLANRGFMVIPVAPGGVEAVSASGAAALGKLRALDLHSALSSSPVFLFVRPLASLSQIAYETGGELATQEKNFAAALDRLAHAVAITYRMERPPDGRPHKLEVRTGRPGMTLRASRSIVEGSDRVTAAALSAVRALETVPAAGTLPVDVHVELLDVKPNNRRVGEMRISVDLRSILTALEKIGPGHIRVTIAVRGPGKQPFVHHEEVDLIREGVEGDWVYVIPLEWPQDASRVAITVEEAKTRSQGSAAVDLPSPDKRSSSTTIESAIFALIGIALPASR